MLLANDHVYEIDHNIQQGTFRNIAQIKSYYVEDLSPRASKVHCLDFNFHEVTLKNNDNADHKVLQSFYINDRNEIILIYP